MNFFDMGIMEIAVVILVALLVFGPEKIPDVARSLGRFVSNLKKMSNELTIQVKREIDAEKERKADNTSSDTPEKSENDSAKAEK